MPTVVETIVRDLLGPGTESGGQFIGGPWPRRGTHRWEMEETEGLAADLAYWQKVFPDDTLIIGDDGKIHRMG